MPTSAVDGERVVVLLGGVNVGGHRLAMSTLRATLESTGCTEVVTYIQSGNAVVVPPPGRVDLAATLGAAVSTAAGYHVPVVLRTGTDLAEVVAANPYPGTEGAHLHVVLFADEQPTIVLDGVDLPAFLPEECTLLGRELYLHLPNGMGRARLPVALERAGSRAASTAVATTRNWNTVRKLLDLTLR